MSALAPTLQTFFTELRRGSRWRGVAVARRDQYSYRWQLCKPRLDCFCALPRAAASAERDVPPETRAPPITLEGDNQQMRLVDAQQQRLLERLGEAGDEPVAFTELRAGGISFPAAVVPEIELDGYPTERRPRPGIQAG